MASPLLANIYLHYVFDLWAEAWRRQIARGDLLVVRFADDIGIGFQERAEAERFLAERKERMQKFGLELHPEKTRLLECGRLAARDREQRGEEKPETFHFLGFPHLCGKTRKGKFTVGRRTIRKRLQAKLQAVQVELRRRRHDPGPEVGRGLRAVGSGHMRYYGVPTKIQAWQTFREAVVDAWHRVLCRRSDKGHGNWDRMERLATRWLPLARLCHPYPSERVRVTT